MKVAFIGCGKISHHYANALKSIGGQICGVTARTQSERLTTFNKLYPEAKSYFSWQEMIKETQPDAIIICISWDQIEKIVTDVIKIGLPVLIEKPVALSLDKIDEILKDIGQLKDNVMVGYNRRFYKGINYLIEKLLSNKKLLSVDFEIPEAVSPIIKQKGQSIEPFLSFYMTSHWIDLLLYTLGNVTKLTGKTILRENKFSGYIGFYESQKYGTPITFRLNYDCPSRIGFKYIFEDETLYFQPLEKLVCSDEIEKKQDENGNNSYHPNSKKEINEDHSFKPGFIEMLTEFKLSYVERSSHQKKGATLEDVKNINHFINQLN